MPLKTRTLIKFRIEYCRVWLLITLSLSQSSCSTYTAKLKDEAQRQKALKAPSHPLEFSEFTFCKGSKNICENYLFSVLRGSDNDLGIITSQEDLESQEIERTRRNIQQVQTLTPRPKTSSDGVYSAKRTEDEQIPLESNKASEENIKRLRSRHNIQEGKHHTRFRSRGHNARGHAIKGIRNTYHKDERKLSHSFYDNRHRENSYDDHVGHDNLVANVDTRKDREVEEEVPKQVGDDSPSKKAAKKTVYAEKIKVITRTIYYTKEG